jgi:hypothetical protein
MNYRIRFNDGTTIPCADGPVNPMQHIHSGEREYRSFTLESSYSDVINRFVDNAVYYYEWDSLNEQEQPETISLDCSEYCIAGEIVDHRDGHVTVYMSKPTETEVLRKRVTELETEKAALEKQVKSK